MRCRVGAREGAQGCARTHMQYAHVVDVYASGQRQITLHTRHVSTFVRMRLRVACRTKDGETNMHTSTADSLTVHACLYRACPHASGDDAPLLPTCSTQTTFPKQSASVGNSFCVSLFSQCSRFASCVRSGASTRCSRAFEPFRDLSTIRCAARQATPHGDFLSIFSCPVPTAERFLSGFGS